MQGCARLLPPAPWHRAWETQLCCLQEGVKAALLPPAFSCPLPGWSGCSENCCFCYPSPCILPSPGFLFDISTLFRAPGSLVPLLFHSHYQLRFFCITDHFLATQIPPQSIHPTWFVCPLPPLGQEPIRGWAGKTRCWCAVMLFAVILHPGGFRGRSARMQPDFLLRDTREAPLAGTGCEKQRG